MALLRALAQLVDQVFHQVHIGGPHLQHRQQVGGPHRGRQIQQRPLLEEFAAEAGERTEQQRSLAIDPAGVEVRHRHRRRPDSGLAVNLGPLFVRQLGVTADQPETADGESGEIIRLRNTGALQQRQGSPTSPEEHKRRPHLPLAGGVLQDHPPVGLGHVTSAQALEITHLGAVLHAEGTAVLQRIEISAGESTEIHIRSALDPGGRHRLLQIPPGHHQRHPLGEFRSLLAPAH